MSDIPEGWARVPFVEVFSVLPTANHVVETGNVKRSGSVKVLTQGDISQDGYTDDISKAYQEELPLIVFGDHTRSVKYSVEPFAVGPNTKVLRCIGMNTKFMYYQLPIVLPRARGYGRHFQFLTRSELLVAPLAEQSRLVAAIEARFTRLDVGMSILERAQQNLRRMRAAVLQAAIMGRLVPGNGDMPIRPLGEVLSFLDQGWSPRCENIPARDERDWAVIKTTSVQAMRFEEEANKKLPDNLRPRTDYELMPGDLLITRAGPRARAGICCLVRKTRRRLMICDKVYRFRPDTDLALPEYLELALNAPSITTRIDQIKTGISDSGVNLTQQTFRELQIPLPDLETQSRIFAAVESQLTIIQALHDYLTAAVARTHSLRSSILAAAFSGKLVPHDPSEEPVSVLLERIASERASLNGRKATRDRKPRALREEIRL